jgi:hypothetical protein
VRYLRFVGLKGIDNIIAKVNMIGVLEANILIVGSA